MTTEKEKICCPHCGEIYYTPDYDPETMHLSSRCEKIILHRFVSTWAEGGPYYVACGRCKETFWAKERVSRTYAVAKTKKELEREMSQGG